MRIFHQIKPVIDQNTGLGQNLFFRIAITIPKSSCSKRIWSITITFYRDRDPDPNAILFKLKKTPSSGRKMIFFLFLFLKTFHIQILNLSSGREVFKTSNQRDGFSSVCESDLWRWILSLFRFLVHTTNVFHLYVQYYLNQKESSTGTFPIAFSCWDGDVSFTPTTGNIFNYGSALEGGGGSRDGALLR